MTDETIARKLAESSETAWEVITTTRDRITVEVPAGLPEHAANRRALDAVRHAFAARPVDCTGFAFNVHHGAEQACPVHRNR